ITRIAGASALEPSRAAEAANKVQKFLVENTRLGIPAMIHEECLSGYMGKGGTTYPQSIGMGSTWDPDLMQEVTTEIRKQLKAMGAHHALSPLADVARDMRWGRVEETFGEDQYLVAKMVTAYVKGLQGSEPEEGIDATLKHYAGHGACEGGRNHAPVNISERELRENHLFPFEAGIRAGNARSVMNAYHDVDGIPCACSKKLLTDILRGEWDFEGIVVSDYFSIAMLYTDHNVAETKQIAGIKALEAGLDIELPETDCYGENLLKAAKAGLISEATIDEAVKRHLKAKFRKGIFENRYVNVEEVEEVFETKEQRELARKAACESMVLLKNEDNLLPLDKEVDSLAVIGPSADSTRNLLGDYAYSAHVESKEDAIPIVSILDGIKNKVGDNTEINYARGCGIMDNSRDGFEEAVAAAEKSDLAIVAVGGRSGLSGMGAEEDEEKEDESVDFSEVSFTTEMVNTTDTTGEHHDRTSLKLSGVQKDLLEAIKETGTPVVAVLVNGRPLAIEWTTAHIPAILEAWLPGEEGGNAVADILFGDYNPGGKLPVSIPRNAGQTPINYNRKDISHNRDYVFSNNKPLYPFGYGLSYTEFEYSNLEIFPEKVKSAAEITIKVDVKNIGNKAGEEIVQLYVKDKIASRTRPVKELKGFKRIKLEPDEKKTVIFTISTDQLAFYDKNMNLIVEPGKFKVMAGKSSINIPLEGEFEITGESKEIIYARDYFAEVKIH
ncbi:MAG: glycoside hydrolase family 3 N-terminal domain-containing protein, partial [Halanaerobiaceae bacterium]